MRIQAPASITISFCIIFSTAANAQLPTMGAPPPSAFRDVAANNEWYLAGAQLGYRFDGNSDFADALIASGRVVLQTYTYPKQSANLGFPVIGNLSKLSPGLTKDSLSSVVERMVSTAEGVNIGLYPYWVFLPRASGAGWVRGTVFGSAVYKVNAGRDRTDSSSVTLNQGRFSVGTGLDLFVAEGDMPLSLSAELVSTVFNSNAFQRVTGEDVGNLLSIELTGIAPLGRSVGLIGQFNAASEGGNHFRVGLVYTVSKAGNPAPTATQQNTQITSRNGLAVEGRVLKGGTGVASEALTVVVRQAGTVEGDRCKDGTVIAPPPTQATDAEGRFRFTVNTGNQTGPVCVQVSAGGSVTKAKVGTAGPTQENDGVRGFPPLDLSDIVLPM